jgi:hypothetical protein
MTFKTYMWRSVLYPMQYVGMGILPFSEVSPTIAAVYIWDMVYIYIDTLNLLIYSAHHWSPNECRLGEINRNALQDNGYFFRHMSIITGVI